ncbi:PREDICTED: putative uncharacterized protein DDB_G0294196 [Dufourea novaeangliae]|uniref:Uncharacterized protein n=1 Tax=Dufourea novaeangliae TaxID=178035 RepID=A0A154PAE1_DUFNO|nr:PREDICTED: putative uncharacterized protein DDB_G0294196 [Dufourea novaeangliae]KZC08787.1 hypothetical protein WN55_11290 [Dufourea novaeangliae]
MYLNKCLSFLLVGLVVVQALPASKQEKKSVTDEATLTTKGLELEEVGSDKNRDKKSTSFCVEVHPDSTSTLTEKAQLQVAPVHTLNFVPQAQMVPQMQTYNIQPMQQQVQAMNVIQGAQLVPQQSFVMPQQVVSQQVLSHQVVPQTIQIIQPSQPCSQSNVEVIEQKPAPTPAPTPAPKPKEVIVEPVQETKQNEKIIVPQMERFETFNIVPVAPACKEELVVVPQKPLVVVPEPTVVKVPNCSHGSHQGMVTQCNCRQQAVSGLRTNGMAVDPLMAMRARAFNGPYSGRMMVPEYHVARHF